MQSRLVPALVAGIVLAMGAAACGKGGDDSSASSATTGGAAGAVKTGPGVTAEVIRIGELSDLSGVFAPLATAFTQAQRQYWKQVNASGGICGRQIKLRVKDHAYDVQKGVSLYRDIEPDVAAISQLVGSPIAAALLPSLQRDKMLAILAAWPPSLLRAENLGIIGATYDVEAINGVEWLMQNKGLKKGDAIGDLFFEGDFGEGGLVGVKHAAEQFGLEVVEQKVKATDDDMSGAVAAFKRAGVKAIWVTTGPRQLASLAGVAKSVGLDVPIGTNGPAFAPQLLDTPVGNTLAENVTVFSGGAPYAADEPAVAKARAAYEKAYPKGVAQQSVITGYAQAEVMRHVLDRACENKDLSREGLITAFRQLSGVDLGGLVAGDLDFTKVGAPSGTTVYALDVDRTADGGLKAVGAPLASDTAKNYRPAGS